jgi:hypothetical protein
MLGRSVAHQEHNALVGEAREGRHRWNSSFPALGKTNSTASILSAMAQFLGQVGHVEDGGRDGNHGEA